MLVTCFLSVLLIAEGKKATISDIKPQSTAILHELVKQL